MAKPNADGDDDDQPTTPPTPADQQVDAAALRRQLRESQAEVSRLNTQVTSLSPLQARVRELESTIRSGKHKERFRGLTTDFQDGALDLIWDKLGVDTSADEPDEAALSEVLERARTRYPFAFRAAAAAADATPAKPPVQPPPAHAGRGGRAGEAKRFTCKKSDHANPEWVFNNSKAIAEARAAGTYEETAG